MDQTEASKALTENTGAQASDERDALIALKQLAAETGSTPLELAEELGIELTAEQRALLERTDGEIAGAELPNTEQKLDTTQGAADVEQARATVNDNFLRAIIDLRDPPDDATPSQLAMAALANVLSAPPMRAIMSEAAEHDEALLAFARMMLAMRAGKNIAVVIELPRDPRQGLPAGTIMHRVEQAYRAALDGPPDLDLD